MMDCKSFLAESANTKAIAESVKVGWGIIVVTPKETAYSLLWSKVKEDSYEDGIFSTLEAACKFLDRNESFIESLISKDS